jgi:inorganic triphosphatase YgiF
MGIEIERQWIAPDDVVLPERIGPFEADEVEQRTIVDTYLDTADATLRAGGARLRIRVQNGRRLATFKRSLEGAVDGVRRREEVEGPADGDPERSDAFRAARALTTDPLEPVGTLHTDRAAREYRQGALAVEAVIDHLRYPDGSKETRVEAEGDEQSVEAFARELERTVAGIVPATTTKGAELERRLGDADDG